MSAPAAPTAPAATPAPAPAAPAAPSSTPSAVPTNSAPKKWATVSANPADAKVKRLLVIDFNTNWYNDMKGVKLANGDSVVVEQTRWKYITVEADTELGCVVHLRKDDEPFPFTPQKDDRLFKPDFLLIRNFPTDLHDNDFKTKLIGLMFCGIPSVNSTHSVLMGMHRPVVHAEMLKIQKRLKAEGEKELKRRAAEGKEAKFTLNERLKYDFPIIPMRYFANSHSDLTATDAIRTVLPDPQFPCVVKVGTTHAGYGKIRMQNKLDWDDLRSIFSMRKDYYTTEGLVTFDFEYRVQKIGKHYRGFRRNSSNNWKNNWGNLEFVDHKLEDFDIVWIDEASKMFGGLDILALDVLALKDGSRVILELNDTAPGLMYEHEKEDTNYIKQLVLERMNQEFCPDSASAQPQSK